MGLKLANFLEIGTSMPIDVLMGSDYYWEFVRGSICKGVGEPGAIHNKLGWVISGSSHDKLKLYH